jgi:cell division protein FtsW (lipid II flippase)/cell division protein FtsI/penicillin-binding protein 2
MRIVSTGAGTANATHPSRTARFSNIEMLGLVSGTLVIVLGVWITAWARLNHARAEHPASGIVNLSKLSGSDPLVPLLEMFDSRQERAAVARAIHERAIAEPKLEHIGGLAQVTLPTQAIRDDARFTRLRERLARRPTAETVPVLSTTDIATIKPALTVRDAGEFDARLWQAVLWFVAAFWVAHIVRRLRRAHDDPVILPALMLLSGIGLIAMLALRDPLRDTMTVVPFIQGAAGGLLLLLAAAEIDFEGSWLRRAMLAPLAAALALAALLLIFGTGPGSSGVRVNLFGFQPVEVIRVLVVFALAAHLARRIDFIRELREPLPADQPLARFVRLPRWKDLRPVVVSMLLVLAFFFLQKDLGPALVLSCVFLALYGVTRARTGFVIAGFAMLVLGFAAAYWIGYPGTVRQRVMIWSDPWNNGVPGGNQVAHGLWALSTGAFWGSGPGLGSPQSIPAGHTDFVLAAIGEELGFVGLVVVVLLYALLVWRCLRVAMRAPGDYTALLATGLSLALIVQAFVIGGGLLGLIPLSGVVTPFLSYGRSSMLANCFALGVILAIARRAGPVRMHLRLPMRALAASLSVATIALAARAGWIQVVRADEYATASSLTEQADGGYRFEYNPRLVAASKAIERGTVLDRNGLPLATSKAAEMQGVAAAYRKLGISPEQDCATSAERCYPLAGLTFSVLGDWNSQVNWGARNSSYVERDHDRVLKGYDDHQQVLDVVNPRTGMRDRTARRDYRDLLPLVRHLEDRDHPDVRALMERPRDLRISLDARLQLRAAAALRSGIERGGHTHGAAIVLDVESGEVLASVSYPWPAGAEDAGLEDETRDALLDRARYGLYPPGSTFKLVVAGAALRSTKTTETSTFACVRLPDGRVGNHVRGWARPVRDDLLDTAPHGTVDLHKGIVLSCNAYFAQLALGLGATPILEAASLFQIDAASPATAASLRGSLPQAGYGQGEVLASPLKMARVAAAIAAGGRVNPVRWTAAPSDEPQSGATQRFLTDSDAARLARFMRDAVTSGTGRALASNPTPIAGKTGTAEVTGAKSHSWFVGFAPFGGSRKIAFAVVIENAGYGGRAAAPIAGEIVTAARELGLFK